MNYTRGGGVLLFHNALEDGKVNADHPPFRALNGEKTFYVNCAEALTQWYKTQLRVNPISAVTRHREHPYSKEPHVAPHLYPLVLCNILYTVHVKSLVTAEGPPYRARDISYTQPIIASRALIISWTLGQLLLVHH